MGTPLEQRKEMLEISEDITFMIAYRKAILDKKPKIWVLIHHDNLKNNYGLEVNTTSGCQCSSVELDEIKEIIIECKLNLTPAPTKKTRKKKGAPS